MYSSILLLDVPYRTRSRLDGASRESEILRGVAGHDKFFFKKYETMYTTHVLRSACLKGVCSHNQTVCYILITT